MEGAGEGREKKKGSLFSGSQQNPQPESTAEKPPQVGKEMKRCPDSCPLFLPGNQSIKRQEREREKKKKIVARRQWWKPSAAGKGTRKNKCTLYPWGGQEYVLRPA